MLTTGRAMVKSKIALLGQKNPAEQINLDPNEGMFASWLAVTQNMWGAGNLTPLDRIFVSTAIGTLAVTSKAIFGAICYHFGQRLFSFSREVDIWMDAFECGPAVSLGCQPDRTCDGPEHRHGRRRLAARGRQASRIDRRA